MSTPLAPGVTTIPDIVTPEARQRIDQALANVPADKRGEAEVVVTERGVQPSIGWKISEAWDLGGYVSRTWSGQWGFGARVRVTW